MCRKRSLTNEQALLQALRGALPAPLEVRRYVGSDRLTLAATAQLFSRAALLTGPHGGAFLNMIYCAAGTPIVEIGYARARPHAPPTDHRRLRSSPFRAALLSAFFRWCEAFPAQIAKRCKARCLGSIGKRKA